MITYKLGICDKFNWNVVLISFNLFSFNFIFANVGAFFKTPQKSPDNRDS